MLYTFLLVIVLPVMAVSIALALLPIHRQRMLAAVLSAHVAASTVGIWLLPEPRRVWLILLSPGMALAIIRLCRLVVSGRTTL
jgi:hypothetical protein